MKVDSCRNERGRTNEAPRRTGERGIKMAYVLGIDVGGTSIKAGLFSDEGQLLAVSKVPTGSLVSEAAFAQVTEGLKKLVHNNGGDPEDVVAVGLDVPGPVDEKGEYVMTEDGLPVAPKRPGYPESYRRKIVEETEDHYLLEEK